MPVERPGGAAATTLPVQAASALVLRPCAGGAEILIVHRHPDLRFLGGYWVFPGGTLDPADAATPVVGEVSIDQSPPPALRVAAARELFEETGLLVATRDPRAADARGPDAPPSAVPVDALSQHPAAQPQPASKRNTPGHFAELLRSRKAAISLHSFQPWAHWITPSALRRRFDTWFFIVAAPAGQPVLADGTEIDEVRWIQPVEWAFGARIADFPVTPPTQLVLRELAHELEACGSLEGLLANTTRRSVPPVVPKLVGNEGGEVVLPWDPEYNELPGEGSSWDASAVAARSGWPSRLPGTLHKAQ